jgi:hypothetical protein
LYYHFIKFVLSLQKKFMAIKKSSNESLHTKKEIKKELAVKMESALPEIKATLGDKKFHRRIKKVAKILVHGLHDKDFSNGNGTTHHADKASPKKIKGVKKTKTKQQELAAN